MAFDDILAELGRTMGLGSLRLDENNVCRLRFGDDLVVDIEHVPARARFYLHAVVGAAPAAGSPLLAEMLGANLFGQGTGDATLAVDPALGDVLLLRGFDEAGSDARGIRHASVKIGEQQLALKPGTFYGSHPRGVHAPLSQALLQAVPLQAQMELELVGTESISVVPLGGDTRVQLTSNWPHPSFGGEFLPVDRKVTAEGFEASWRVSSLASTAQQDLTQRDPALRKAACPPYSGSANGCVEAFSVTFVDPSNTYALSDRAPSTACCS